MTASVEIVAIGPFGDHVARVLAELLPGVCRADDAGAGGPVAVRVLAAWRPVPALARELDARSRREGAAFLPVVAEPPRIVVGPVSVPNWPGCWACYQMRVLQHDPRSAENKTLLAFYDAHPEAGPAGYLPVLADLAAARAAAMLRRLEGDPNEVAGRVWQVNVLTARPSEGTVVGVHGCPSCGLGRNEEERSSAELHAALRWLYESDGRGATL